MSCSNVRILIFLAAFAVLAGSSGLAARAADTKTISAVEVQEQDGVTRIVLRGAEDPIYTAFMREDPPRLIVELPDVEFSGVDTPIQVGSELVQEIALGAFGDPRVALSMARVSVGLSREAEYELLPDGDELVIEIRPLPEGAPATGVAQDTTAQAPAAVPAAPAPEAPAAAPAATTAPAEPAAAKSTGTPRLLSVTAHGSEVEVVADGAIDNFDSFTLENPSRLVIDFWNVKSGVWPASKTVAEGAVAKWRVGEHADKVRVVLDLRDEPGAHQVEATSTGVRISLGTAADASTADDDMAAPAAADEAGLDADENGTEPHAADGGDAAGDDGDETRELPPSHWTGPARVDSVHFESLPETDRVVVTLNHPAEAQMVRPDDATVIVMLKDAEIEREIERRVDTKDFGGPIEHFSVFKTPDVDYDEVRIVLKRHGSGEGQLLWVENQLHVELPRSAPETAWEAPADGGQPAGDGTAVPNAPADGTSEAAAAAKPGQPVAVPTPPPAGLPGAPGSVENPFEMDGPADPASIDILAEGGFSDEKEYTGRRISLDFKDADIANILRLIAEVSDLNVIAGEEVDGTVTIRLVDVPWDQALDVILLTKGLGFVRVGNVLRIAPLETIKLEAEARLQERRAKEKLEDLVVKLQPVNYADVKEVRELVKKLLSKRGTVNTDNRTNTLIIKDIPSVVQEATALVKAIDTATPQVLIESKIVEASLSFSRALGATWGLGYQPFKDVPTLGGGGGTTTSSGGGEDLHLGDGGLPDLIGLGTGSQLSNFIAANPIFEANTGFLSLGLLGLDDHLQLDLAIEAAESNNKGKVISSPRVVTLDNREAVIKQGVAIKFEASTDDKITISFIDAVLELKVTPHITANRSIIMKIKISRNAPSLAAATGEIVGIDKNEAETEALIRDGETIVLGGIYVVDSGKSGTKTPFLADIPLLGSAFKSRVIRDTRRELLIFVTPRIIMGTPGSESL